MKLIKRRTQIVYKELTDLDWQLAYTRYLEAYINHPTKQEVYRTLSQFQIFGNQIWHPIREVEKDVESEENFIQRVTKTEAKDRMYNRLQFIANQYGEIVSCVLF